MRRETDAQKQIARRCAACPFATFSADAYNLTILHAARNADLDGFGFRLARSRISALQRDGARSPAQHFLERDQHIAFNVRAGISELRRLSATTRSVEHPLRAAGRTSAAAEEMFEEITEPGGAVEVELVAACSVCRGSCISSASHSRARFPIRWRLKTAARLVPIRPKPVVFLSLPGSLRTS